MLGKTATGRVEICCDTSAGEMNDAGTRGRKECFYSYHFLTLKFFSRRAKKEQVVGFFFIFTLHAGF